MDYLVEISDEATLRALKPNLTALAALPVRGIIVTCRSESPDFDFVSRFFAPRLGIDEDPVTGSAHCALVPYWSARLGRRDLHALQVSDRGGELFCKDNGERVAISGRAVRYMQGTITIG